MIEKIIIYPEQKRIVGVCKVKNLKEQFMTLKDLLGGD